MLCYIRKIKDHHGFWNTTSLVVCSKEKPANIGDYEIVQVETLKDIT